MNNVSQVHPILYKSMYKKKESDDQSLLFTESQTVHEGNTRIP